MTNGRKTTFDERVEIVQYCISHAHNYAETAEMEASFLKKLEELERRRG